MKTLSLILAFLALTSISFAANGFIPYDQSVPIIGYYGAGAGETIVSMTAQAVSQVPQYFPLPAIWYNSASYGNWNADPNHEGVTIIGAGSGAATLIRPNAVAHPYPGAYKLYIAGYNVPTPTPTLSPTETPTKTPTITQTPTKTPTPTITPTPTPTPVGTVVNAATPTTFHFLNGNMIYFTQP